MLFRSEARSAIGWVIVGGLLMGTLFTLFVIPTAYTLLVRRVRVVGEEEGMMPAVAGGSGSITVPHTEM